MPDFERLMRNLAIHGRVAGRLACGLKPKRQKGHNPMKPKRKLKRLVVITLKVDGDDAAALVEHLEKLAGHLRVLTEDAGTFPRVPKGFVRELHDDDGSHRGTVSIH